MTSRKSAADREGWKRGAGAYSKEVKLTRGTPWSPDVLSDGDEGLAIADKHAKHASNDAAGLKDGLPYEATAETHDIFDDVAGNQGDGGNCAIKSRG